MPSIQDIVIDDGESTPVAHTYEPIEGGSKAFLQERLTGVPLIGQGTLNFLAKENKSGTLARRSVSIGAPIMEAVSGQNAAGYTAQPQVAHTVRINIELIVSGRATELEITNVRTQALNLLSNADVVEFFDGAQNLI